MPARISASASETFWQQIPTAPPRVVWSPRDIGGFVHLGVGAQRDPEFRRAAAHPVEVALERVEIDDQGGRRDRRDGVADPGRDVVARLPERRPGDAVVIQARLCCAHRGRTCGWRTREGARLTPPRDALRPCPVQRHRPPEQVALHLRASLPAPPRTGPRLDPLGGDGGAELGGDADHGAHTIAAVSGLAMSAMKERSILIASKGSGAGSSSWNSRCRNRPARCAPRGGGAPGAGRRRRPRSQALGDLDLEPVRRQAGFAQGGTDGGDQRPCFTCTAETLTATRCRRPRSPRRGRPGAGSRCRDGRSGRSPRRAG